QGGPGDRAAEAARPRGVVVIRGERGGDAGAVEGVHREAFGGEVEAKLVRLLRERREATVSLVAVVDEQVVGHVVLSPVTFAEQASLRGVMGLGPVGVLPAWQRQGIGAALVRAALSAARDELAARAVVVLGDPAYYGRFGFEPGAAHGLSSDYGEGPAFMVALLRGPLPAMWRGRVRYAAAFGEAMG
ncbi:MAG: N-acetyltransferase, partial [Phycisphaeraceae bacterium]